MFLIMNCPQKAFDNLWETEVTFGVSISEDDRRLTEKNPVMCSRWSIITNESMTYFLYII